MSNLQRYAFNAVLAICVSFIVCGRVASAANTPYCGDYFREQWNVRLDMSDKDHGFLQDIPDFQLGTVSTPSYSNGIATITTTGTSPRLTPLQYTVVGSIPVGSRYGGVHRIDTSTYRYFNIRMHSSTNTTASIIWQFAHDHYATTSFTVYQGWRTYSIDLAAVTPGAPSAGSPLGWTSGSVEGITFLPSNASGVTVQVDWLQLTRADCATYDANYNGGTGLRKVVIDDNMDTTDGYQATSSPVSGNSHSISRPMLFPGTYNLIGVASPDWAVINFGSGLNMNNSSDIRSDGQGNIGSTSFSGGAFHGTTTGADPGFYVGIPSGQTFNAATYKYLTIDITMSGLGGAEFGQVYVFNSLGGISSYGVTLNNGANNLQIDISGAGTVNAIRIDPTDFGGRSFALNYVAIRSDAYAGSESLPTESFIDTLTVQDLSLDITQPDERGGVDFAQSVLGKTWNMNSSSTFVSTANLASATVYPHGALTDPAGGVHQGDYFYAVNETNNGDPIEYLVFLNAKIDTSRFVNFCFKGWNANETPVYNSVGRLIWSDPRVTPGTGARSGDDIVYTRGNQEYCLDLRQLLYAQIEPPVSNNPWTDIGTGNGGVDFFRFDTNENSEAGYYSVLDYISLRTDHEANSRYAIVVDAPRTVQVNLAYNTTATDAGATAIGNLGAGRSTNTYAWDTTNVPNGYYYIIATMTSGSNTLVRTSKGRVNVNHSLTQDTTAPILTCERPFDNYQFDTSLEIAGYALDETRIASVEVFTSTDNTTYSYFNKITRSMFHLGAQTTYGSYADANAPGFQTFFDSSGLAYGTQYIRLVATDTGGNTSSCTYTTTRVNGGSTPALVYPSPDNNNTVPVAVPTPTPAANPKVKAVVKNADVNFTITGCSAGGTLLGQTSKKLLTSSPVTIGTATTAGTSAKLPALKAGQPASIFIQMNCGGTMSTVTSFSAKKIKNKKKSTTLAAIFKQVKKKFKGR